MATTVAVYPRQGTTYPDAAGVEITSAGAIVDVSKYIKDAISAGFLLTYDPLSVYQPDDRTDTGGGGGGGDSGLTFNSVTSLAATIGSSGQSAHLLGYYSPGDGGGGTFYWAQGDSTSADGGLVFGASPSGRWKRVFDYPIHCRWFGAKGDNVSDDTAALQAWIDSVTWGKSGFADPGQYKITAPLRIYNHHATFEGPQSATAPDNLGFCLQWAGSSADNVWAVYIAGISTMLRGWGIQATTALYGGFNIGQQSDSTIINTRCHLVDCCVQAQPFPGSIVIKYGFGVGVDMTNVGNQDFNYFENCVAKNMDQWGWDIVGGPNCLSTTLRRCVILNQMGTPAGKKYIAAGLSDGLNHPYGGGVRAYNNGAVDIDGLNLGYVETGYWRARPDKSQTYTTNDRIVNVDCEHVKKPFFVRTGNTFGSLVIENGRFSGNAFQEVTQASLGPTVWEASDRKVVDVSGPCTRLSGLCWSINFNINRYDDTISLLGADMHVTNCALPSVTPFIGRVASFGNYGPNGDPTPGLPLTKIRDSVYTGRAGGVVVPPAPEVAQRYITALGGNLRELFHAEFGVETNLSGRVLAWTSCLNSLRMTPASSGARPTFAVDGSNFRGKPVVQCTAAGTGLYGDLSPSDAFISGFYPWVCSVYRLRAVPGTDGDYIVADFGHALSNDIAYLQYRRVSGTTTLRYDINNGSQEVTGPTADTNQHTVFGWSDTVNMNIQVDNGSITSAGGATYLGSGLYGFSVGRQANQPILYSDTSHAMHLVCAQKPSASEITALLRVIAEDWGVA